LPPNPSFPKENLVLCDVSAKKHRNVGSRRLAP